MWRQLASEGNPDIYRYLLLRNLTKVPKTDGFFSNASPFKYGVKPPKTSPPGSPEAREKESFSTPFLGEPAVSFPDRYGNLGRSLQFPRAPNTLLEGVQVPKNHSKITCRTDWSIRNLLWWCRDVLYIHIYLCPPLTCLKTSGLGAEK